MVLFWGCDPETTPWGFVGQFASRTGLLLERHRHQSRLHLPGSELRRCSSRRQMDTHPPQHRFRHCNWPSSIPGSKKALYNKDYIKTHTVGFEKIEDLRPGQEKTVSSKTPDWASKKCGVPEWTIKALARDWAKKTVSIAHYFGGSYIRGPYSHEPARLECVLLAMQGLGWPGVGKSRSPTAACPAPKASRLPASSIPYWAKG